MTEWPDHQWITGWVESWGDRMTQFAYGLVQDTMIAQDVVQEAFLRLYQWHRRHPGGEISVGWLYTVTRNLAFDALRDKKRRPLILDEAGAIDSLAERDADGTRESAVLEVLETMDAEDRECLSLFYYADFSTKEIARRLKLSEGSVRTRLYRARLRFKELWKERS